MPLLVSKPLRWWINLCACCPSPMFLPWEALGFADLLRLEHIWKYCFPQEWSRWFSTPLLGYYTLTPHYASLTHIQNTHLQWGLEEKTSSHYQNTLDWLSVSVTGWTWFYFDLLLLVYFRLVQESNAIHDVNEWLTHFTLSCLIAYLPIYPSSSYSSCSCNFSDSLH